MAGIMAPVVDGKLVDKTSETENSKSSNSREVSNTMDKQAFLQLLVAQMQYQDPLEPTDNTEYVAQLATFSELEAMTNLNESMNLSRASGLVGKAVSVVTTTESGMQTEIEGIVDYVMIEGNEAYLVIDGKTYSIDDLTAVMSDDFWNEYQELLKEDTSVTAQALMAAIASEIPADSSEVTLAHKDMIKAIRKAYDSMTEDEKQDVSDEYLIRLIKAETQIAKLEAEEARKEQEASSGTDSNTEGETGQNTTGDTASV